jgi:monoamine oxidase
MLAPGRIVIDGRLLTGDETAALSGKLAERLESDPPAASETLMQWQTRARCSPAMRDAINALAWSTTMLDPWIAGPHGVLSGPWGASVRTMPSGMVALGEALADGLELRLGHAVRSVQHLGRTYRVTTDRDQLQAEHVVVAVPPDSVTALGFSPPLDQSRLEALYGLRCAGGGKLAAQYADGDELRKALPAACLASGPISAVRLLDPHAPAGPAVLTGFVGGSNRSLLRDHAAALAALDALVGVVIGHPPARLAGAVKDWSTDPFARAVMAVPAPGQQGLVARLAHPHNRISFAGDWTAAPFTGTLDAAVRSGLRAAAEVLARPAPVSVQQADELVIPAEVAR